MYKKREKRGLRGFKKKTGREKVRKGGKRY